MSSGITPICKIWMLYPTTAKYPELLIQVMLERLICDHGFGCAHQLMMLKVFRPLVRVSRNPVAMFWSRKTPLGLNAKGSLCIYYWSIPCGWSFSSSNRANEVWLKSMTVYCELYITGYTMAISV
jgi:hypothetical protein